jgi:hypothetical protein
MKSVIYFFILCFATITHGQTTVNGKVKDGNEMPIEGANIYIEGSYDGGTSNAEGEFSFKTVETGKQNLIISFLSYETFTMTTDVSLMKNLQIKLREDVNALDAVVLSAGTFSAGDNSKVSVLKPLDVVTTASALGD